LSDFAYLLYYIYYGLLYILFATFIYWSIIERIWIKSVHSEIFGIGFIGAFFLLLSIFFILQGSIQALVVFLAVAGFFVLYAVHRTREVLKEREKEERELRELLERYKKNPEDFGTLRRLGMIHERREEWEKAIEFYERADSLVKGRETDAGLRARNLRTALEIERKEKPVMCKRCGKRNRKDAIFCERCRRPLRSLKESFSLIPVPVKVGFFLFFIPYIIFMAYLPPAKNLPLWSLTLAGAGILLYLFSPP